MPAPPAPPAPTQRRAGVYTRISLDRSGEGLGVARQSEDAHKLAAGHGWSVVSVYEDNDISAAGRKRRPQFEALIEDIQGGRIDVVVTWALDRLTRSRHDTVRLIEACTDAGVTIACVRGGTYDLSDAHQRMITDMLASIARAEIEIKSGRQQRANRQRAEKGLPHAGPRPVGYASDGVTPLEPEATAVRDAYAAILAGASLKGLARQWNSQGLRTSRGGPWIASSVRRALRNPRYAGLRVYRGEVIGPGTWEPLVDEAVWRQVDRLLADPARRTSTDTRTKFLLTRIAECGRCGDGSTVATARTSRGARTYKCVARGDLARAAEPIDRYVAAVVLARLTRPDVVEGLAAPRDDNVGPLTVRAAALRERLRELEDAFQDPDGGLSLREYLTFRDRAREDLEAVEDELAAATQGDAVAALVAAGDVEARWGALDVLQKRAIVRAVLERIVLLPVGQGARRFDPASVVLVWRGDHAASSEGGTSAP